MNCLLTLQEEKLIMQSNQKDVIGKDTYSLNRIYKDNSA